MYMSVNFNEIKEASNYQVSCKGKVFQVKGSEILSALCPACKGSGQISVAGAEPRICEACDGMGMLDYSQTEITPL